LFFSTFYGYLFSIRKAHNEESEIQVGAQEPRDEETTRSGNNNSNGSEKKGRRMGERLEETHDNQTAL
jgi:hypothetical protein